MLDFDLAKFAAQGLRHTSCPGEDGYIASLDARLYFASFGVGTPVILLHGGMGNGTNWALQVEALVAAGYNAIVLDTRGHGRSTPGSRAFSYALFSEDVLNLMGHLQIDRALFVGWSDGACTALELARTNPSRVMGVIYFACNVDPSGNKEFVMTKTIENCLIRHQRDFERLSPTQDKFEELPPKLEPMQKNQPNYTSSQIRTITVPVAVLHAQNDEFIKASHSQYLASTLPKSFFELMDHVSHFAPIQDAAVFNTLLLKYARLFT
jgi:hypothetical protein